MLNRLLRLPIILILLVSCGKFTLSPYISDVKEEKLNASNLELIKQRESKFTNNFKIAVISDTHDYYKELDKIVKDINSKKDEFAFAIVTGDITNIGLLSEFKEVSKFLKQLEIPYLVAIGNHDYLTNGFKIYSKIYGSQNMTFTFKQSHFVIYDNNNWEALGKTPDLDWVESELTKSTSTHKLLFSHVSPEDTDRYTDQESLNMKTLFNKYNVKYYINGHDHNPAFNLFGSIKRVTVGSPAKKVYVELTINDTEITHKHINI